MSEITNEHEGLFKLDHIALPFHVRQMTNQSIEIDIGKVFCQISIMLRNDGNIEVLMRDWKSIKGDDPENIQGVFLGNVRKDW